MNPRNRAALSENGLPDKEKPVQKKAGKAGGAERETSASRIARKKSRKRKLLDALVVLLCLLLAALFFYLFWIDFYRNLSKSNVDAAGIVTYKKKAVQRRFQERVIWDRVKNASAIYNGDTIRTGDISEATVTFNDGQYIDLDENSIIEIIADENGPSISVSGGGVSVKGSGRGVAVSAGGKKINIDGDGEILLDTDGGGLKLAVSDGAASIVNADGTVEKMNAGKGIRLGPNGEILTDPAVMVYKPKPMLKIVSGADGTQVEFFWNNLNFSPDLITKFELSSDRNFNKITASYTYDKANAAVFNLPAGVTYWRAYPVSRTGGVSWFTNAVDGKVTAIKSNTPRLVTPAKNEVITYRSALPLVRFQWTPASDEASYKLIVANNADFSGPVTAMDVQGTSQSLSALGEGTWYWRVEPVFSIDIIGNAQPSPLGVFSIKRQSGSMPPPVLSFPLENGIVNIARNGPEADFLWKADSEAAMFNITISREPSLTPPLLTRQIPNNYFVYSPSKETALTPGRYYWTVSQQDAAGGVSQAAAVRSFYASVSGSLEDLRPLPPPVLVSPQKDSRIAVYGNELTFKWQEVAGAQRYKFCLFSAGNTAIPLYEMDSVSGTSTTVSLPTGSYSFLWTVQGIGRTSDGAFERSGNTAEANFTARRVKAAALISPANDAQVAGLASLRGTVNAVWTLTESVKRSRFVLSTSANVLEGRIIMDVQNPVSPLKLPALPTGRYFWTITAETTDGFSAGALSPASFIVGTASAEPVALLSPPNGAQLSIEDTRRAGLIEWTSTEAPARTRFVLSRNADPLSGTPLLDIQNPPRLINVPPLEPGVYYWTISGVTAENLPLNARTPFSFTIMPEPPLSAVVYTSPLNGAVVNVNELRNSRRIHFTWRPVEGATEYTFTLRDSLGNIIGNTPPFTQPEFTLNDISFIANGGVYRWSVTAVQRGADGRIERTSVPSEASFTIDFPRPERLEAIPPGELYGQ